jgi:hypothetical protein
MSLHHVERRQNNSLSVAISRQKTKFPIRFKENTFQNLIIASLSIRSNKSRFLKLYN